MSSKYMLLKQNSIQQNILDDYIFDLEWSPNGNYLAAITSSGQVGLANMKGDVFWIELGRHKQGVNSMKWHPRESLLATGGQDGKLTVWDTTSKSAAWSQEIGGWIDCLSWSSTFHFLASSCGKSLSIWSVSGKHEQIWTDHESTISDIEWSPDGCFIAATAKGGITIRGYGSLDSTQQLQWHGCPIKIPAEKLIMYSNLLGAQDLKVVRHPPNIVTNTVKPNNG